MIYVPVSGGKDSQSCLKLACETQEDVVGLFCDTKFEHPDTYKHIERMSSLYNVEILTLAADSDVISESLKYKRFPSGLSRHCTDALKIQVLKRFIKTKAEEIGGFEVWFGMRSDESPARAKRYAGKVGDELMEPHEMMPSKYPKYLGKMGIRFRLPILEWSKSDVFDYLKKEYHPHYDLGFDRVGCFPCLAGGDKWKLKAFQHDEFGQEQYKKVLWLSEQINKSVWTSKGMKQQEEQGCLICSM